MRTDPARKGAARIPPSNGLRGRRAVPEMRQGPPELRSSEAHPGRGVQAASGTSLAGHPAGAGVVGGGRGGALAGAGPGGPGR